MPMKVKAKDHSQQMRQTTHHHWQGTKKQFHAKHTPNLLQKILIVVILLIIIAVVIVSFTIN